MTLSRLSVLAGGVALVLACGSAFAQPNVVNGRDVKLQSLNGFLALGRTGAFPNGLNGCAESTTSCNVGTVNIPWNQVMGATHPFISFLAVRVTNGRMEQISDRSFVKHGFFATNSPGCGTCFNPGTSQQLGIGCADTYSTTNNGDNFWLGPADEIDCWTGTWVPQCSHFDKGEPQVNPPQDCDGVRSLSNSQASALGVIGHRMKILDADFNVPGSQFFVQAGYTTQGELESKRTDNMGWRKFTPTWTGASWNLAVTQSLVYNSVLSAWPGATLNSNTNLADDGRVYVATNVTGPVNGLYHYEVAVHNRDSKRGIGAIHFPVCSAAAVVNAGFNDIDADGSNQWTFSRTGNDMQWSTTNNSLRWNTVYNFWFDSDAAPASSAATLDHFSAGVGANSFQVVAQAPLSLPYNVDLGGGCGLPAPPLLSATGAPAEATLGNATFGLQTTGVAPGASTLLWASPLDASLAMNPSCTLNMDVSGLFLNLALFADGSGVVTLPAAIPNDPLLEGIHVNFAVFEFQFDGAIAHQVDLSNTLRVHIGNTIGTCP